MLQVKTPQAQPNLVLTYTADIIMADQAVSAVCNFFSLLLANQLIFSLILTGFMPNIS
jgi:hypothetical protein